MFVGRRRGIPILHVAFNPNKHRCISRETGQWLYWGMCTTLADLEIAVAHWARREHIPRDKVVISRIDFAINQNDPSEAARWKKRCDLLIACFNVMHDVGDKQQYYGSTQTTLRAKNNRTQSGIMQLEVYNKAIQQEKNGAIWRFEIRCDTSAARSAKRLKTPQELFQRMLCELAVLPDYYDATLSRMNENLLHVYQSGNHLQRNTFIKSHQDRFFSRGQVEDFCELSGAKHPKKAAKNYLDRYEHLCLTKSELQQFVWELYRSIEMCLKNEACWPNDLELVNPVEPG